MKPIIPKHLDPLALGILEKLSQNPESRFIVLGGYFALKHYLDYRETKDIDAWWLQGLQESDQKRIFSKLKEAIEDFADNNNLTTIERRTRNMQSIELHESGRAIFSFQIANRDRQLQEPLESPYSPILIETLDDNLASKMTALIYRGAPRDFRDIYTVVENGLSTIERLWELAQLKNPDLSKEESIKTILHRLISIEQRRPLSVLSTSEKEQAIRIRSWYKKEFIGRKISENSISENAIQESEFE